jgi:hemin uptake protein HemP
LVDKPEPGTPEIDANAQRPSGPRTLDSDELLQGGSEVAIRHNGRLYRLSRTRSGKLILT